jgi:hypothetical protein
MFFSVSTLVNQLLHEHFVKNGCFIEKSPFTSSNCYKTMKTASILIKLGKKVDWTIAFVKYVKSFFDQNCFQSAATSQWIEIESKAFQLWMHVTL